MTGPTVEELFALFPDADDRPAYRPVAGEEVPEPYRDLLVHEHHMTVTVEAHHGGPVDVRVLQRRLDGDIYAARSSSFTATAAASCSSASSASTWRGPAPPVRAAIVAGNTPVGRILIEHDVLRRIEPMAYLRVEAGPAQMAWFGLTGTATLWGRLANIHFDGRRVVEVLEIVGP